VVPRALIVDDDEPIRALLAAIVAQQGFAVETARDGEEAIAKIAADASFSVILLDLMMPRVNGYDVLGYIVATNPHLLTRTIIATAVPEREIHRQITQPVFKIHLKPFELPRLIADLRLCASS
jgi:CheY-like chemotaxis protein